MATMPSLNDRKFCESQFYDVEDTEGVRGTADAGFLDPSSEKEGLLTTTEILRVSPRRNFAFRCITQLLLAVIVISCISLVWTLHDCLPAKKLYNEDSVSSTFHLVKDAVSASPSGVLEDFQVYQPVFTPSGATDETTTDSGLENTTTIAQTTATSSCQVLLMNHSFAFSYGIPFVGKCNCFCVLNSSDAPHRKLHSAQLQI
jgi:hypothetical protein